MKLEKVFETLEGLREKANVKAAFGEPEVIGEKTIIPIAQVGYRFGMGFGEGKVPEEEEGKEAPAGRGGGGGGGALAKPIAVLEVTAETTRVTPILDSTKIALASIVFLAWAIFLLTQMLNKVFGENRK